MSSVKMGYCAVHSLVYRWFRGAYSLHHQDYDYEATTCNIVVRYHLHSRRRETLNLTHTSSGDHVVLHFIQLT